jgi:uncharacterized membrane protein (DUF4010 family)
MGLRVIALVGVINRDLLPLVAIPMGGLALAGFVAGGIFYVTGRKNGPGAESVQLSNPFELSSALKVGALFAVVLLGAKAAIQGWGQRGGYLAALLAGTVDVDAVSITLSRMPTTELPLREAALGVFLACASNSVVKAGIAVALGGWSFGWRVVLAFLGMVVAGSAGALFLILRP